MAYISTESRHVTKSPTISAAVLYTAGDALGDKMTIDYASTSPSGTGRIKSVQVTDQDKEAADIDIIFFSADFTATTDNDAINISDADAVNVIGTVSIAAADYVDIGEASVADSKDIELGYKADSNKRIYAQAVVRSGPTYTATDDLQFRFHLLVD